MQFRTKIVTFAVLLACGAAVCATLTLALARGIERDLASVTLAEDQLALYLTMETNISDMLRLQITAAAAQSPDTMARLAETKSAVRQDVATIRDIVQQEIALRGEEEARELLTLDRIELVLDDIEAAFNRIAPAAIGPQPIDALAVPLLEVVEALDDRLAPLVDRAVADEAAEVIAARNDIAELSRRSAQAGTVAGALTLLAALVGTLTLLSSFMRPFGALIEGASRLAQGDLSFRIPEGGRDELGRLSRDFNQMAVQIERSDRALRAEEEELQHRVAERTAELEEANARLAAQDATRRRFLADVSHELRTPLTVMRGEAEVALRARDASLGDGARDALAAVVEQSEHMSRLVDDLLFVARRDAGEAPLRLSRLALGDLLERTVTIARQLAPAPTITLQGEADALATPIEVDRGRLHQLLMVLLDNALRYSPEGGTISIETERVGPQVTVAVRDSGIGIPRADLPHVFDRFVRGSNALPGGTGLGLPVAKAIAEAHGGQLTIDSREGRGTCVTLTLPITEEGTAQ
ncbi:HAMP domain-containing protein [Rhodovulum sp. ES.010]|uniref:sensor histidine kinase n=1 Tax=Rhodovulum sp. ES.010 TaxID=1882821 RepID=UPI00092C0349|nr:ATP-binding protein [Rhodovulum sp. ES.010]SIO54650.1 HAMP domain-containing protein [Rhodovulum sp. ES.010]